MSEHDWTPVSARVTQRGESAQISLSGTGDPAAAPSRCAALLLMWTRGHGRLSAIATRSSPPPKGALPDIARAASIRPTKPQPGASCAAHSRPGCCPSRRDLIVAHGNDGAFPRPMRSSAPSTPENWTYPVGSQTISGLSPRLRSPDCSTVPAPNYARRICSPRAPHGDRHRTVRRADLVLIRGANAQDVLPRAERRLAPRSPTSTGPNRCLRRSQNAGAPSAPGPRSTSVRSESSAPMRWADR
jgi:DNA-3-methyladenine glycosylase II